MLQVIKECKYFYGDIFIRKPEVISPIWRKEIVLTAADEQLETLKIMTSINPHRNVNILDIHVISWLIRR